MRMEKGRRSRLHGGKGSKTGCSASAASMLASRMPMAKVRDLLDLNKAVEAVEALSTPELKYLTTATGDLGWGTITRRPRARSFCCHRFRHKPR